ncbi:MAG: DNA repair protein RecO [Candidatus Eremiobacteraeota bacterium]|nr:DNA repair protein RecO [Candidatus Eremiobacteraeota bacterium]MBV8367262.1 DNA repair protein RecO [Candidatus Eremiobacteraeota bacterium]
MRSYAVEAVVLRLRPLGEADRIVTLFSRERGKLHAVAKGSRRPGSRFGARLDFFSLVALELHKGRSLDVVTGARAVVRAHDAGTVSTTAFWARLVEPQTFALASYAAEVIDALSEPDMAVPDLFDLLCELRDAIAVGVAAAVLAPALDLRLLAAFGLAPELDACARCGSPLGNRPLAGGRARLAPGSGGLVCRRCAIEETQSLGGERRGATYSVSATELTLLRRLRTVPLTSLLDLFDGDTAAADAALARLRRLTRPFVEHQLGRRSKALSLDDAHPGHGPGTRAAAR